MSSANKEAVTDAEDTRTAQAAPIAVCAVIVGDRDEQRKFLRLQERAARAGHTLLKVSSGYMLVRNCASHHSASLDVLSQVLSAGEDGDVA